MRQLEDGSTFRQGWGTGRVRFGKREGLSWQSQCLWRLVALVCLQAVSSAGAAGDPRHPHPFPAPPGLSAVLRGTDW